jgi:hypothetical protein
MAADRMDGVISKLRPICGPHIMHGMVAKGRALVRWPAGNHPRTPSGLMRARVMLILVKLLAVNSVS